MRRNLTILMSASFFAFVGTVPAGAAVTVGTLSVSVTVAYPCTVITSPGASVQACRPTPGVAAPRALRILRRDARTGITTLTIEF